MRINLIQLGLLVTFLVLAGCKEEQSLVTQPQPVLQVAVLNLDRVAEETNMGKQIDAQLVQSKQQLEAKLQATGSELKELLDKKGKEFGEKPTEEQIKILEQMRRQAELQLFQGKQDADRLLQQQRVALVKEFRELVRPIAAKTADQRDFKVVLLRNDMILYFQGSVDITGEVINEILKIQANLRLKAPG